MTCGIPIVASVSGYAKDVIVSHEAGIVSETNTADEMLRHILYLYQHPSKRGEMSRNSLNYVKKHFFWEKNIEVLIRLIENKSSEPLHVEQAESVDKVEVL
jgi:glycosyltransferase involved in cell wall biosynthesis